MSVETGGMEFYWVTGQTNSKPDNYKASMATVVVRTKENHRYIITTPNSKDFNCTCPDSVYRNKECKHIVALKQVMPQVNFFTKISLTDALRLQNGAQPEEITRTLSDGSVIPPGVVKTTTIGNIDPTVSTIEEEMRAGELSVTLTPDAVKAVKQMQEPEKPKVLPEDDYDVKDIESLRKVMLTMRRNERTEDEAFDKLRVFLRTEGITEENKNQVKEWMTLITQSWEDLLEEIDDVAD